MILDFENSGLNGVFKIQLLFLLPILENRMDLLEFGYRENFAFGAVRTDIL